MPDLVALILPASTSPLQLVQADRFLEKRKQDPKLPIDDKWDDAVKNLVVAGADAPEIKREAVKNGMRTLRQSALRKLAEGQTTFEEVVRVTGL